MNPFLIALIIILALGLMTMIIFFFLAKSAKTDNPADVMDVETAGCIVINFGKYKENPKPLFEIYKNDPKWIRYIVDLKHPSESINYYVKIIRYYDMCMKTLEEKESFLPYKYRYFFSKREYQFYKQLRDLSETNDCLLMAKVRLADLVEVDSSQIDDADYKKYFWKLSQKHVDFILVNKKTNRVEKIVEIDDASHNQQDRKERDKFVDNVLEKCGYKVYHIWECEELEKIFQGDAKK